MADVNGQTEEQQETTQSKISLHCIAILLLERNAIAPSIFYLSLTLRLKYNN